MTGRTRTRTFTVHSRVCDPIDMTALAKAFYEAGVQSACPMVEALVEEYPTEAVISYNCRHRCDADASKCCYCTFYR